LGKAQPLSSETVNMIKPALKNRIPANDRKGISVTAILIAR